MKNVCIFDRNIKYSHIIKSFLLAQNCRVSVSSTISDAINKLALGIFDGFICIEDIPKDIWNVITNVYEGKITLFFITNQKNVKINTDFILMEPFSLLDFALLIKKFVNTIKKCECTYYVEVKKNSNYVNCVLENPTEYGGVIYPASFTMNSMNVFNSFFRDVKDTFAVEFHYENDDRIIFAKPVFYEYTPNKLIIEVFVNFLKDDKYMYSFANER